MVPLFAVHLALINALGVLLPDQPLLAADMARLQSRLSFDAVAITIAVAVGYVAFLYATITEARRYFRVHAEMELAAEIHGVLVPSIDAKLGSFQFYGYSSPSGEVGGDLIDLAGSESRWVAYVADVSGHGVAPGVVAGMVKSAARMLLSSAEGSLHLQSRLNEVLYPLKKPDMFVTFCLSTATPVVCTLVLRATQPFCAFPLKRMKWRNSSALISLWELFRMRNLQPLRSGRRKETCWLFTRMDCSKPRMPREKNLESTDSRSNCRSMATNR